MRFIIFQLLQAEELQLRFDPDSKTRSKIAGTGAGIWIAEELGK
jgi:hypothetical protein